MMQSQLKREFGFEIWTLKCRFPCFLGFGATFPIPPLAEQACKPRWLFDKTQTLVYGISRYYVPLFSSPYAGITRIRFTGSTTFVVLSAGIIPAPPGTFYQQGTDIWNLAFSSDGQQRLSLGVLGLELNSMDSDTGSGIERDEWFGVSCLAGQNRAR